MLISRSSLSESLRGVVPSSVAVVVADDEPGIIPVVPLFRTAGAGAATVGAADAGATG